MRKLLVVILTMFFSSSFGFNDKEGMKVRVTKVIDGNTIEILTDDDEVYQIMFKDVDSPEIGQNFGEEAKRFTEKLLLKKKVTVEMKGKDMWGNRLAGVTLNNGKNIEQLLIEEGLAWYNSMKSNNQKLAEVELKTKETKKGLWSESEPTPPWIFRRQQSMATAKSR